jgi:hypothetical protein
MKSTNISQPKLHPQAQVIITGSPITSEQAKRVIQASNGMCFDSWCGDDGSIGYLDSIKLGTSYQQIWSHLCELSNFTFLNLGVSVMNGPPKTPTYPVASFLVKDGIVKKTTDVHYGHPPPKRITKKTVQDTSKDM